MVFFLLRTIMLPCAHMNVISQMLCEWQGVIRSVSCEAVQACYTLFFTLLQRTSTSWHVLMPKPVTQVIPALFVNIECTLIKSAISIVHTPFFFQSAHTTLYTLFFVFNLFQIKWFIYRSGHYGGKKADVITTNITPSRVFMVYVMDHIEGWLKSLKPSPDCICSWDTANTLSSLTFFTTFLNVALYIPLCMLVYCSLYLQPALAYTRLHTGLCVSFTMIVTLMLNVQYVEQ